MFKLGIKIFKLILKMIAIKTFLELLILFYYHSPTAFTDESEIIINNVENTHHCPSYLSCRKVLNYKTWKDVTRDCFEEALYVEYIELLPTGSSLTSKGFLKSVSGLNGSHLIYDKQSFSSQCKLIRR